ncbi:MAG: restriction endonuclease subunit S [Thiomicrospira sp.]
MEQVLYELPEGWDYTDLASLCKFENGDRGKNYPSRDAFVESGIPVINAGNLDGRKIIEVGLNYITRERYDILGSGKLRKGDLLFCLRGSLGKCAIVSNLSEGAIASSLVIVRPTEALDPNYLLYYFNSSLCATFIERYNNGAAQPNLSAKSLSKFLIPLASLKEQKRIVEKLDALLTRIDTAIEHLQESITLADSLYASELASVFSLGQDKSPLKELNEVAEVARGKSKHRPRNDKSLFGGEYPFIQTGDVRNAQKYITTFSATYNEKGLQQSKLWPKGTICLTIAANIGDVAILGMDACFPDSVVGISSSELETDYLYYFLTTLQQQLDSKANAAAQKNINLKILSEIKIPVPTIDEQKNIVKQIKEIDQLAVKLKAEISEKITKMQQLKASILDSAFKGEL